MSTETKMTKHLDEMHQLRLAVHGLNRAGRRVLLAALAGAVMMVAACSSAPESKPIVQVDRVTAAKSRISAERDAGVEARGVCAELGMEQDADCRREIAGARLGLDAGAPLGKFVK